MSTKKPTKPVLASRIVQKTINDFLKDPTRWIQESWGEYYSIDESYVLDEQIDAFENSRPNNLPKVREPGNGLRDTGDIFEEIYHVVYEPAKVCGLGGVQQSAYSLNRDNFWERKFQTQLATAGVYLDAEAKKLSYTSQDSRSYYPFECFVEFNDNHSTTLKDVLALMRRVVKQLKAKEAKEAAAAEKRAQTRLDKKNGVK